MSLYKWLAGKLAPFLFSPIDYESINPEPFAPAVEMHDYVIIKPGDEQELFRRENSDQLGTSWLVLDLSDFGFGTLDLKIELCFSGSEYLTYVHQEIDSQQAARKAWDVELPPSRKIRVTVSLLSGRKTKIAYHYYYCSLGV